MKLAAMFGVLWCSSCTFFSQSNHSPNIATLTIKHLGIYYGWPSLFDGVHSVDEAITKLSGYDVLVFGADLEQPEHTDHSNTHHIIQRLKGRREFYGYISLSPRSHPDLTVIVSKVERWKAMGVAGIFFDEAGYDFGVTRTRQNQAIDLVHQRGLKVFINAFDPADVFSTTPHPRFNPRGEASILSSGDCYLYESFGMIMGKPEAPTLRRVKMIKLAYAQQHGIRIFGITTSPTPGFFDAHLWKQVIQEAHRLGLDGLGWGEYQFAATDNRMPFRGL